MRIYRSDPQWLKDAVKKRIQVSHFSRSKKYLEDMYGCIAGKTEMPWNQYSKVRQDLFGIFDMIAAGTGGFRIVGVQVTNGKHAAEHRQKILDSPNSRIWALAGGRILMLVWNKVKNKWVVREEWLYVDSPAIF